MKLREGEERKQEERQQAGWTFSDARAARRDGDLPTAALNLLSRIYSEADEHAVALPYIRQFRKLRRRQPDRLE